MLTFLSFNDKMRKFFLLIIIESCVNMKHNK